MSWFSDANCQAASILEHAMIAYAVDFEFDSGHVRLWSGTGDLTIGADTYYGTGDLGNIKGGSEKTQLVADTRTYTLAYVEPGDVPESEIDNSYGLSVTEYEVWFNPETRAVIGTEINWEGRISSFRRRDGAIPVIEVDCESRLVAVEDADNWRYTKQHQEEFFAGDTGLDNVAEIESVDIIWGGFRTQLGRLITDVMNNRKT